VAVSPHINSVVIWLNLNRVAMLAVMQYIFYCFVGGYYYVVIATVVGSSAAFGGGFRFSGLVLLFLSLLLFGFVSGLSFFFPRIAATIAGIFVLPFLYIVISVSFPDLFLVVIFGAPSAVVVLVSVFALLWSKVPLWSQQEHLKGKVILGIFAAIPALLATWTLASIVIWLSGFQRAT